eukprot:scaffold475258_cov83-Attheya_sp.AAC.2
MFVKNNVAVNAIFTLCCTRQHCHPCNFNEETPKILQKFGLTWCHSIFLCPITAKRSVYQRLDHPDWITVVGVDNTDYVSQATWVVVTDIVKEFMAKSSKVKAVDEYLYTLKIADRGFDCCISFSPDGQFQGVVWVTSQHMHWSYVNCGLSLFLDAMKREQNALDWPYISVVVLNGYKKIENDCKSVSCSECIIEYKYSLRCVCPKCPLQQDITCIFGDGILDNTLDDGFDLNADILGDSYHFLDSPNSVWRGIFKSSFSDVSPHLHVMVNSHNESDFDSAYTAVKKALG